MIAAQTGDEPVFAGAGDFDLDLLETRTLDGRTQELVYRPTPAPGRPADQTARPCRRQGLPGLPWRWRLRPSCMPHGACRPSR